MHLVPISAVSDDTMFRVQSGVKYPEVGVMKAPFVNRGEACVGDIDTPSYLVILIAVKMHPHVA